MTVSGAMRQNVRLEKTWIIPRSCSLMLSPFCSIFFSGTTKKTAAATARVMMDKIKNTPRQSVTPKAASTGAVAVRAPNPPAAI